VIPSTSLGLADLVLILPGWGMVATAGDALRATVSTLGSLATIAATSFGIYEGVKRLRTSRPRRPATTPVRRSMATMVGKTPPTVSKRPSAPDREGRQYQPRLREPRTPVIREPGPTVAVRSGSSVAVAVASWVIGSILAVVGAYVASRLVGIVIDKLELVLPSETSFRSPWTWLTCAGVATILMGAAVAIAYEEFESDAGILAFSLVGLLALPGSFIALGAAEGLGWAVLHFVDFNYATVAWPTLVVAWLAFSGPIFSDL
jgi:hypothetical protein